MVRFYGKIMKYHKDILTKNIGDKTSKNTRIKVVLLKKMIYV